MHKFSGQNPRLNLEPKNFGSVCWLSLSLCFLLPALCSPGKVFLVFIGICRRCGAKRRVPVLWGRVRRRTTTSEPTRSRVDLDRQSRFPPWTTPHHLATLHGRCHRDDGTSFSHPFSSRFSRKSLFFPQTFLTEEVTVWMKRVLRNFATDGKGTPSSGSERGRRAYLGVLTSEWRGELGAALETLA